MATDGTSNTLMIGEYTEGSSRLFVGNLTMNSEASVTGFGGGVVVASGDVNGDEGPDTLTGQSGDIGIFNFQPQLTTETTEPTATEGTFRPHPYLKYELSRLGADGPDTLTSDVTDQSVEVVGQPTETIWMTYGHIEY